MKCSAVKRNKECELHRFLLSQMILCAVFSYLFYQKAKLFCTVLHDKALIALHAVDSSVFCALCKHTHELTHTSSWHSCNYLDLHHHFFSLPFSESTIKALLIRTSEPAARPIISPHVKCVSVWCVIVVVHSCFFFLL